MAISSASAINRDDGDITYFGYHDELTAKIVNNGHGFKLDSTESKAYITVSMRIEKIKVKTKS